MRKSNLYLIAFFITAILFAGTFFQSGSTYAEESGLVTVQSKESFDQTVKDLRQYISKNGMMVLSEINQGKVLSMTGLSLNAISLFVGNPQIGNKLFSADRGVGIAVPVRLNIYENTDGKTYISYVKPTDQLSGFKEDAVKKIANMLDKKLGMLTGMVSK